MEENIYMIPVVHVLEFHSEGVMCGSVTENVEFEDGEW